MYSSRFLKFIEIWQKDFAIARSIDEKLCLDKYGQPIPWYTYPAIEYLSQFDYSDKYIFEYGCGYSSPFWAHRAKKVISIEDNEQWYHKWQDEFKFDNLIINLIQEGADYYSSIAKENAFFDVIVIDGKCRAECAKQAVKYLRNGGFIILDDSDRVNTSEEYVSAIKMLKNAGLLQIDFYGFSPMDNYTKATSVFFSRTFDFNSIHQVQPINGIGNLWGRPRKQRKDFYKNSNCF